MLLKCPFREITICIPNFLENIETVDRVMKESMMKSKAFN